MARDANLHDSGRRNVVATLGGLGLGVSAGCIGDEDDVEPPDLEELEDDTDVEIGDIDQPDDDPVSPDAFVEEQEYRLTTQENLEELIFVWSFIVDIGMGELEGHTYSHFPWDLRYVMNGLGGWSRSFHDAFAHDPGDVYPGTFQEFTIEPEKITLRIHEDGNWSDGEPITAWDVAAQLALHRANLNIELLEEYFEDPYTHPPEPQFAVENAAFPEGKNGKIVEFLHWNFDDYPQFEEYGGFLGNPDWWRWYPVVMQWGRWGLGLPFHEDPWASMGEAMWERWQEYDLEPEDEYPWPAVFDRVEPFVSVEDLDRSREPGGVPMAGPWILEEPPSETEVRLQPNEQHWAAEDFNFERVVIEYAPEAHRRHAALQAGIVDYDGLSTGPELLEALAEEYEIIPAPASAGYCLNIDHASEFRDRKVRQAVMFAISSQEVANVTNLITTEPISIPGWHMHGAEEFLTEEWASENLIDYSQDLDTADRLMREAGFERMDGMWTRDGERFHFDIATPDSSPVFEETVADQLQEFGIDARVRNFDSATFSNRVGGSDSVEFYEMQYGGAGDFTVWTNTSPHDTLAGWLPDELPGYWSSALSYIGNARMVNFFEHEFQEAEFVKFGSDGWSSAPDAEEDARENFIIEIPPIGEPDGAPVHEFNLMQEELDGESIREDEVHRHQVNAWALNWWLPGLPIALEHDPHFLNSENWNYPTDLELWDYFGIGWNMNEVAGLNLIQADPSNPKSGATVRDD